MQTDPTPIVPASPRRSLNFGFLTVYGAHFDRLGVDVEGFVHGHPDLALVRSRQLVELLVLVLEQGAPGGGAIPAMGDLSDRIAALARTGVLPGDVRAALDRVRQLANGAVHVNRTGPQDPRVFDNGARRALTLVHRAVVWLHGHLVGHDVNVMFRAPAAPVRRDSAVFDDLMLRLDEAEALIDLYYALAQGAAVLASIDTELEGEVGRRRVTRPQLMLLRLRSRSIDRARRNHQGDAIQPADLAVLDELGPQLVATNTPAAIEEVAEYRNRVAVGFLNAIDFEQALSVLDPLLKWQRDLRDNLGAAFGGPPIVNAVLGCLLGTEGQALAFRAHAYGDRASLDDAIRCFDEARGYFADEPDRERQETYAGHALVEKIRHFAFVPLNAAELRRLTTSARRWEADAAVLAEDPLLREHPKGHAFGVALALKHACTVGTRPAWFMAVCDAVARALPEAAPTDLGHPLEQIIGYLMLVHPGGVPAALVRAAQAQQQADTLPGHIARTFDLERRRRAGSLNDETITSYRQRRPAAIAGWWTEFDLDTRLEALRRAPSESALRLLPFNYS